MLFPEQYPNQEWCAHLSRRFKYFSIVVALLAIGLTGMAQQPIRYVFKHIGKADGFPANRVYSLYQDRKGFIWMGTDIGLVRYDGEEFVTYKNPPTDSVTSMLGNIGLIQEDCQGWIWFFSIRVRMYVNVLDPNTNKIHHFLENGKPMHGYGIYERGDSLYLSTDHGIQPFNRKTMTVEGEVLDSTFVWPRHRSQWTDFEGRFWARGKQGVVCYDPVTRKKYHRKNNPFNWEIFRNHPDYFCIRTDAAGNPWMTTADGEFYYFNFQTGKLLERKTEDYFAKTGNSKIKTVTLDQAGQVWFGTETGRLCRYFPDKDSFDCIVPTQKEPNALSTENIVDALLTDREGNIWVDADGGVDIFNPTRQNITTFRPHPNRESETLHITGFLETRQGDVFILYEHDGVDWLDARFNLKETLRPRSSRLKSAVNYALAETDDGKVWIGGSNGWITALDPVTRRTTFFECTACKGQAIRSFYKTANGDIWLAVGFESAIKWDVRQRRFIEYPLPALPGYWKSWVGPWSTSTFYEEGPHRMWTGTYGYGVTAFDPTDGKVLNRYYTRKSGTEEDIKDNIIYGIVPWKAGSLLVAAESGLKRIDRYSDTIVHLAITEKLPFSQVFGVYSDHSKHFWVTTNFGLCVLDSTLSYVRTFDWSEGLAPQSYLFTPNTLYALRDGRLLVGTYTGDFFLFHPDTLLRHQHPLYDPVIAAVEVSGRALLNIGSDTIHTLSHKQNNLTISFGSLSYGTPGITYQYHLEGLNPAWVNAGDGRSVSYAYLPPGHYTFRVRALTADGRIAAPAVFQFIICPPWYQSWWFYLLAASLLMAIAWAISRDRIHRFRERTTYEKRLADLQNQALRAQMNPHFIFNALQSVKKFVLLNDVDQAEHYMSRFARLMRQIMDNSREATVPLRRELELLDNYLQLEQLRFGHNFDFRFELAPDVYPDELETPSMTLQPFVENAVLHGLAHLADRHGRLLLRCSLRDGGLLLEIEDNGVGRARAEELKNPLRRRQHRSAGMDITRKRLALFSAEAGRQAWFNIHDLYDEAGNGCGTRVEIWLPEE